MSVDLSSIHDNETLHRIEHKLDILLEKMRLSSVDTSSFTPEQKDAHEMMVNSPPSLPQDPRICGTCLAAVKMIPHAYYDKDGKQKFQGYYRACGCKITTLNGIL